MKEIMFVGLGGFIGAALRYMVSSYTAKTFGNTFPYGTLIVNVAGCLLIGFILSLYTNSTLISDTMKLFLTTGILGGLTTFSTFSSETIAFFVEGNYFSALMNTGLNLFLGFGAVILGRFLSSKLISF